MENLESRLDEINEQLKDLKKKKSTSHFFEVLIPGLSTVILGIVSIVVSINQSQISELQVQIQQSSHRADSIHTANQLLIQENQNKANQDRQYIALIYEDVVSGDQKKINAALKLVKKMRPEVGRAFLEILEGQSDSNTEPSKSDIEEIQVNYSNSLKSEKVTIGIHRLNYSQKDELMELNSQFQNLGYEVIGNFNHNRRAAWMATRSTVFYYGNERSKERANEIAEILNKILNEEIMVQKGAGLGVDKNRKSFHHFVHIISSN